MSRVNRSLALVNLTEKKGRVPSDLSGGEKQRLVIASILAMEPKILVFDEPITDLDPDGQRDVLLLLERLLTEKHRTAILVDHESDHLASADRVAVLAGERLVGIGTPREIFRDEKLRERYRLKPLAHLEILSALGIKDGPLNAAETIPILKRLNRSFDREETGRILSEDGRNERARTGSLL